jgi:hypothetical protein
MRHDFFANIIVHMVYFRALVMVAFVIQKRNAGFTFPCFQIYKSNPAGTLETRPCPARRIRFAVHVVQDSRTSLRMVEIVVFLLGSQDPNGIEKE